uniref:Putative secreted protein n=1 Tax=Anopheles darlingi TaxID=43151 RepID=A0A2M4DA51_ANODA
MLLNHFAIGRWILTWVRFVACHPAASHSGLRVSPSLNTGKPSSGFGALKLSAERIPDTNPDCVNIIAKQKVTVVLASTLDT